MTPRQLAAAAALLLVGLLSVSADEPDIVLGVADAYIAQDAPSESWTVGNEAITFRVGLNADGILVPLGLGRPGSDTPWTIASTPGPSFQQSTRRLSLGQAGFPFQSAYVDEYLGGVRLALVFSDAKTGLRVTRSYVCYPGAPAIETWATFEAVGSTTGIPISDIGIWQLVVPVQEANWVTGLHGTPDGGVRFTRLQQALAPRESFEVGSTKRSSESVVPTLWFRGPSGRLFGGPLWSGTWLLTARLASSDGLTTVRLSAGATATTVKQGEPFESPHGVFGIAADGDIAMTTALQQYVTNGLRHGRPINPPVTYNTWFSYGTEVDDESIRAEMQSAAALGVELFVLDAGWSPGATSRSDYSAGLGSWTVDTRRFPVGLGPLGDYARSLGMKFGVWVEPERVATSTVGRSGQARERYLATIAGRYNAGVKNEHADSAQVCLADAEARQWVLNRLVRFIDQVRPDHLKWDNNYWINCDRSGHGHGTQDGNYAHVRGLYELLAELRARYPDMTIENCSGGGNRLDLGMLRYTDVAWMDDVTGPSAHVRHNLQGLAAVFPPRYLLSFVVDDPAEPIHQAADMPLYFRSRMAGALGISLIGAEFAENDLTDMAREITLYKRLRDTGPEPILALLTGQASLTSSDAWDAVQLLSRETGSSFMLAFRGNGADGRTSIRPVGLQPDVQYEVSAFRTRAVGKIDGAALMEYGVKVGTWAYTAGHVVTFTPVK